MPPSPGVSIEPLERREHLSVTVTFGSDKGKLTITGDAASDVVEVYLPPDSNAVQVYVNGVAVDPTPNSASTTIKKGKIEKIVADMGAGDDEVYIGHLKNTPRPFKNKLPARCVLVGGDGNDILQGGPQVDTIVGGAGDDVIFCDRGDDLVFGGSGNDQILGENGRDNLFGQDGNDRLNGGGNQDNLYGMAGADDLVGGEDKDFLNADPGPGDTHDNNEKPDIGETQNVDAYVAKLIQLEVPEKFRAVAKS